VNGNLAGPHGVLLNYRDLRFLISVLKVGQFNLNTILCGYILRDRGLGMENETDSKARKEALAEEADERIKSGSHWRDWMFVADGFVVGQAKAMRAAGTNRPYGKAFTRAMGDWLKARPWANGYDKGTRSNLLWCADHRNEIEAWRESLAQNERDKLNHPSALKRRYDAAHKVVDDASKTPKKETKAEAQARENEELWAENAKLKRQAQSEGSLFDLHRDSIEHIADVICRTVTIGRAESLRTALTRKIADLKAAEKTKTAKAG
jgi:hypothetical protein